MKEIYDGTFSGTKIPGQGVFAKMLMDEGIRVLDAGELPKNYLEKMRTENVNQTDLQRH